MNSDASRWFDLKYSHPNQALSIEDRLAIVTGMEVQKLPERVEDMMRQKLEGHLFELERGYSPSRHARTQLLLECVFAFGITDPTKREGYKTRFIKALEKHKPEIPQDYSSQED